MCVCAMEIILRFFFLLCVCVQGRSHIFKIHAAKMSVEKGIRFELLARLCPNSTGVCVCMCLHACVFRSPASALQPMVE